MAPLKNSRHEAFAQQLVIGQKTGWTRGAAYSRSGYRAEGKAADVNASRLLSNANNGIAARVQEIVGRGAKRAEVTVETLLGELEEARSGATSAAQYGAATHATLGKARLAGLMRDKIEIGGPGEFDLKTPEDVVDRMLDQDDPERLVAALDALRGLILQRASERAVVVLEEPPPFRSDEVAQSLALLRPPPKGAHRSA